MKTRKGYLRRRNGWIRKSYRNLRRQGFTARKCYEIISQQLEGELSPSSVKKVIYSTGKKPKKTSAKNSSP
ncbi:hypothetical protein J7M00_00310 [bacterium]|nr:hypothetical protein [bacterium]